MIHRRTVGCTCPKCSPRPRYQRGEGDRAGLGALLLGLVGVAAIAIGYHWPAITLAIGVR